MLEYNYRQPRCRVAAGRLPIKEVMAMLHKSLYIEHPWAGRVSASGGPRMLYGIVSVSLANFVSTDLPAQGTDAAGAPTSPVLDTFSGVELDT